MGVVCRSVLVLVVLAALSAPTTALTADRASEFRDNNSPWPPMKAYFEFTANPPGTLLQNAYTKQALAMLEARQTLIGGLHTAAAWKQRQEEVHHLFMDTMFHPLQDFERTPLNPRITKEYHDPRGFTVTMLTLETQPKYYMTCALFVPDEAVVRASQHNASAAAAASKRMPAVVFPSGHWPESFRNQAEQQPVILNLVLRGMAVLAYDPPSQGERLQYINTTSGASDVNECTFVPHSAGCTPTGGRCTAPHSYYGRQAFLNNATLAGFWIWDGMRAVDYLQSLDVVDSDRIGVAGCSGGGTQSSYLSIADDRIGPATIACYMSTFQTDVLYNGAQDAEQIWPGGLARGLDKPDILEVRAPRPTLTLLTTDDTVFPLQGGRDAFSEAQAAYEALGAESMLEKSEAVNVHGWITPNNEHMYDFFARHFGLANANKTEMNLAPLSCDVLMATSTGQIATDPALSASARFMHDLVADITSANIEKIETERTKDESSFLAGLGEKARSVSGMTQPAAYKPRFLGSMDLYGSRQPLATHPHSTRSDQPAVFRLPHSTPASIEPTVGDAEKWLLPAQTAPNVLALQLYKPAPSNGSTGQPPVLVVLGNLDENGQPNNRTAAVLGEFTARGAAVLMASLSGLGEPGGGDAFGNISDSGGPHDSGFGSYVLDHFPLMLGESHVGVQAGDVLRVLDFVARRPDLDASRVGVLASMNLMSAVLHAVVGGQAWMPSGAQPPRLAFADAAASYASIAQHRLYDMPHYMELYGVLAHYDLPDLVAALAPTPVLISGPVDGAGSVLDQAGVEAVYAFAQRQYARHAATEQLVIRPAPPAASPVPSDTLLDQLRAWFFRV